MLIDGLVLRKLGGLKIPGEDDSYDFGTGAGFYVDATKDPWKNGYRMYSYVTEELPKALFAQFEELDASRMSITGHSMGGHGALTLVCSTLSGDAPLATTIFVTKYIFPQRDQNVLAANTRERLTQELVMGHHVSLIEIQG